MSQQTTFTGKEWFKEGNIYEFEIVNIQGKSKYISKKTGEPYCKQSFFFTHDYLQQPLEQRLFENQVAEILIALGYSEEKNNEGKTIIKWDDDEVIGQKIKAMVTFRTYINTKGKEKKAIDLINFQGV